MQHFKSVEYIRQHLIKLSVKLGTSLLGNNKKRFVYEKYVNDISQSIKTDYTMP